MYSNSTHLGKSTTANVFHTLYYSSANVERLWCCHISTDNGYGRRTDRKNATFFLSGVHPVMKVVSMAMRVFAERVRRS